MKQRLETGQKAEKEKQYLHRLNGRRLLVVFSSAKREELRTARFRI
jgi:hypothetical protein